MDIEGQIHCPGIPMDAMFEYGSAGPLEMTELGLSRNTGADSHRNTPLLRCSIVYSIESHHCRM